MDLVHRKWGNGEDRQYVSLVSQLYNSPADEDGCNNKEHVRLNNPLFFNVLRNFEGIII